MGNGSYNADAMSIAYSAPYYDACKRERTFDCNTHTLSQAHYRQYAAVPIKDLLSEWDSDEFKDCEWYQYWQIGDWYDREDVWIAPGEPIVATSIVTDGDGDDRRMMVTGLPAQPEMATDSVATKTRDNGMAAAAQTGSDGVE